MYPLTLNKKSLTMKEYRKWIDVHFIEVQVCRVSQKNKQKFPSNQGDFHISDHTKFWNNLQVIKPSPTSADLFTVSLPPAQFLHIAGARSHSLSLGKQSQKPPPGSYLLTVKFHEFLIDIEIMVIHLERKWRDNDRQIIQKSCLRNIYCNSTRSTLY